MSRILGFGIATIDIINSVEYYPEEDEELRAKAQRIVRGGNVCNTLSVLSQTNHSCSWAGSLADDENAAIIVADLKKNKINIDFSQTRVQSTSPVSYITLNQCNASRTIVHYRDLAEFEFKQESLPDFSLYDWVHFEGRAIETTRKILESISQLDRKPIVSLEAEKPRKDIESLFHLVNFLMCSKHYMLACKFTSATEFLVSLNKQYPNLVASCTLGEQGAYLINQTGQCYSQAEVELDVIDTIGAGDVFNAGLIDSFSISNDHEKALNAACKLASKKVCQVGFENLF